MPDWFSQLLLYAEVSTIARALLYFNTLGGAALEMTAESRTFALSSSDREMILRAMLSLPPHTDVNAALKRVQNAGLRLVTLTNSNQKAMEAQLKNAGI